MRLSQKAAFEFEDGERFLQFRDLLQHARFFPLEERQPGVNGGISLFEQADEFPDAWSLMSDPVEESRCER